MDAALASFGPEPQADRPDLTGAYNTPLSPSEESQFQKWLAKTGRYGDLADYDLRGAWKTSARQAANGHLPDTFKKPNHPTFSNESKYNGQSGAVGGQWLQRDGRWVFSATPYNVQNMGPSALEAYFRRVEPDSTLLFPGPQP